MLYNNGGYGGQAAKGAKRGRSHRGGILAVMMMTNLAVCEYCFTNHFVKKIRKLKKSGEIADFWGM